MKLAIFFILKSHAKNLEKYYAVQRGKQKVCFTFKDDQLQSITLKRFVTKILGLGSFLYSSHTFFFCNLAF